MDKIKIAFVSLGCSKNLVDSQMILGTLLSHCSLTEKYSEAEVIFINTCAFIEAAKKEAIDTILEMAEHKASGKCRKLIVLGCLAERYKTELEKELPEVDLVLPINRYKDLKEILSSFLALDLKYEYGEKRQLTTSKYSAYLKVADGCDNHCSYCAIPLIRKRYRSTSLEQLISEAKWLIDGGVRELVLIAQDTTRYGLDIYGEKLLAKLLKLLNDIEGKFWIRVLYMYPALLTEELIDVMNKLPKVLLYFDVPLQHGSDRILKLMNRRGSVAEFLTKVEYLDCLKKPYVLRTTMMVGFPGETNEDFNELLSIVKQVRFHKLGAFVYSREEDTSAFDYEPEVDQTLSQERFQELLSIQQDISRQRNEELLGKELDVLVEAKAGKGYLGRSLYQGPEGIDGMIKVRSKNPLKVGEFYKVIIKETDIYDLFGDVVNEG